MDIKGTQTEKNILEAFAGESMARNKYTYFAEVAKKEGNTHTAELFEKMAENEKQHAKLWFKFMEKSLGSSTENLISAISGENFEWTSMYKGFAETARKENLETIASMFDKVAEIEKDHEKRFMQELALLASGGSQDMANAEAKSKQQEEYKPHWHCPICGKNEYIDGEAPYVCSLCGALGAFVRE